MPDAVILHERWWSRLSTTPITREKKRHPGDICTVFSDFRNKVVRQYSLSLTPLSSTRNRFTFYFCFFHSFLLFWVITQVSRSLKLIKVLFYAFTVSTPDPFLSKVTKIADKGNAVRRHRPWQPTLEVEDQPLHEKKGLRHPFLLACQTQETGQNIPLLKNCRMHLVLTQLDKSISRTRKDRDRLCIFFGFCSHLGSQRLN